MDEHLELIAAEAAAADGAAPLDEGVRRLLTRHPERARTWLREDGFAVLVSDELGVVVRPTARGHGLGAALLEQALTGVGAGPVQAWSHGDHPAAAALAAAYDFDRVRDLWVMRRPSNAPLPELIVPDGVAIRAYRPGDPGDPGDMEQLLAVNAASFADHREQGAMDAADLAERMAEDWFDAAGLLLGVDPQGELLGFHWTKRHSDVLGEVYVVGISPAAQGRGLGSTLTLAGLHHLVAGGAQEILLYVESDNAAAIAVYSRLGFTHAASDTHVMYLRA